MINAGLLNMIADMLDGENGRVIVHDGTWSASETTEWVSEMSGVIAQQAVTLSAAVVAGVLEIGWTGTVSINISGASVVGGWVLAEATGSDATSAVLRSAVHPGGDPPDPYTVTISGSAIEVQR